MKLLNRDKKTISYELYSSKTEVMDNNLHTGEYTEGYSTAVTIKAVVKDTKGEILYEPYGMFKDYEKTITIDDMTCPIAETTRITIDNVQYAVKRISKYQNVIIIGVSVLAS